MYPKSEISMNDYQMAHKDLKYVGVWFPIEYKPTYNSNFIHVGNVSHGCITCYQLDKWNDLYAYLIRHRLDKDGLYVGTLVIEK